MPLLSLCTIWWPSVNSYWSYRPEVLDSGQSRHFLAGVTLKYDGWHRKTTGHLFYATSTFVHHFVAICELQLELQSGNAQFKSISSIFWPPSSFLFIWYKMHRPVAVIYYLLIIIVSCTVMCTILCGNMHGFLRYSNEIESWYIELMGGQNLQNLKLVSLCNVVFTIMINYAKSSPIHDNNMLKRPLWRGKYKHVWAEMASELWTCVYPGIWRPV